MAAADSTATAVRGSKPRRSALAPAAVVLIAPTEHTARRIEAASRRASWSVASVPRLSEAEHAIGTRNVRALVIAASESTQGTLRRISRHHPTVATMIWAPDLPSETVAQHLLAGAADVLTPTMSDAEIYARLVRALGASSGQPTEVSSIGDLSVDTFRGETIWRGERVPLTNRERDVLDVLVQEQGKTLRRDVIYQRVWGHAMPNGDRNVDVNVKRLRHKLANATAGLVSVETVSRVGYRLEVNERTEEGAT